MVRYRVLSLVAIAFLFASLAITGGVSAAEHEPEEADFDVEITGTNAPVAEGETLVVNATITNTGDMEDSQEIHLKGPDMEIVDSVIGPPLTLAPNESENVTLRWETGQGDAGNATFSVQSDDDFPLDSVTVEKGAFFDVSVTETNEPISAGETVNVTVSTTNTGGAPALAPASITVDGSTVDMAFFYLHPGESGQAHMTWNTSESDSGVWTLVARTEGDRAEEPIVVEGADTSSSEDASTGGEESGTDPETTTTDTATPTARSETATAESSETDTDTATPAAEPGASTETEGDGSFGVVAPLVALITIGRLVSRRRN